MARREEWAKRVQRWADSELTAAEFATEVGINPRTLAYWKWKLGKDARDGKASGKHASRPSPKRRVAKRERPRPEPRPAFVEVTPAASVWSEASSRIEVVVEERYVVRVPDAFEPETLKLVVSTLSESGR